MNRSRSGYVYIVLCAVIFSTMEVMLKTVHGVFAPMQITCLRFLVGDLYARGNRGGHLLLQSDLRHGVRSSLPA